MDKKTRISIFIFPLLFLLVFPQLSRSIINPTSRFSQAGEPASQLDLLLFRVEQEWKYSILQNSDYFKAVAPLVSKTRVFIHCYYDKKLDKIDVIGFIFDEENFFSLSLFDRKELLKQTLNLLMDFLAPKITYRESKKHLHLNDIKLELVLNSSPPYTRGLLKDLGVQNGQAGFVDGKLIFSEELYLTIRSEKAWQNNKGIKNTIIMIPFSNEDGGN